MTSQGLERWTRNVFPPRRRTPEGRAISTFTGIFGDAWIDNAIDNLNRQATDPHQAVVALNGSSDPILSRLLQFQEQSRHEVWIVVNDSNLGPMGSYCRNRDLIRAPWTAFMHQDDIYLPDHITTLRELIASSSIETLGVFTSLGGISEDGRRRTSPPPMENRHLRGAPPWITVPEIIRRHPFPTPAFAVRSSVQVSGLAWYDSGAPDSEWFARLACLGSLTASDRVTVLYRQPSGSESSQTDWHTRAWLWAASLERVISSPEFQGLLMTVPDGERHDFAASLLEAIPARYPASDIFRYLQFVAAQRMCDAWDYGADAPVEFLGDFLSQWGVSAAVTSLDSLSGRAPGQGSPTLSPSLLGRGPKAPSLERAARSAYRRYGHLLPDRLRRRSLRAYQALRRGVS